MATVVPELFPWLRSINNRCSRYAFDVIGELYFGQMFGFMDQSRDIGNYIRSLDALVPSMTISSVAPPYLRPILKICGGQFNASIRDSFLGMLNIAAAARGCVAKRMQTNDASGATPRRDILQQLLQIYKTKGDEIDFGVPEIEAEAHTGL
jgi:hypothetical protein